MKYKLKINKRCLKEFCKVNDLQNITKKIAKQSNLKIYMPYSTKKNFINRRVYPKNMPVLINTEVWENLKKANADLNTRGIKCIIYDAYRPIGVQYIFWEYYKELKNGNTDELLVANPDKYGTHNIKIPAIDIMPANLDGSLNELPCDFDDFTGDSCVDLEEYKKNFPKLYDFITTMQKYNLIVNPSEYWHFVRNDIFEKYGLMYNFKENFDLIPLNYAKTFEII